MRCPLCSARSSSSEKWALAFADGGLSHKGHIDPLKSISLPHVRASTIAVADAGRDWNGSTRSRSVYSIGRREELVCKSRQLNEHLKRRGRVRSRSAFGYATRKGCARGLGPSERTRIMDRREVGQFGGSARTPQNQRRSQASSCAAMWSARGPCSMPASRASRVISANRLEGFLATDARRDDTSCPMSLRAVGIRKPAHPVGVGHRPRAGCVNAEARDHVRALPTQRPHEVPPGEGAAARTCAEERHRLAVNIAGAHDPVERVLHHAGDRAGILGRGDQHGVRLPRI